VISGLWRARGGRPPRGHLHPLPMGVMDAGNDARWEDNTLLRARSAPLPYLDENKNRMGPTISSRRSRGFSAIFDGGMCLIAFVLLSILSPAHAAFLNFENCLEKSIVQSNPLQLQFIPMFFSASYDPASGPNPLNVTVYGNVSGLATDVPYPPPDSPQWTNPNDTVGKITDLSESNDKWSTLFTTINVLSFTPYNNVSRFCLSVTQGDCPLGPVFYANAYVLPHQVRC
jgi:hypothetical protein